MSGNPYVGEFRHIMKNAVLRVEMNLNDHKLAFFWLDVFRENVRSILKESDAQFQSSIREIAKKISASVSKIHERILANAQKEAKGVETDGFLSVITELQSCLDPYLSEVLPILQEFNKTDSLNVGTDLLHIWYGCGRMLS